MWKGEEIPPKGNGINYPISRLPPLKKGGKGSAFSKKRGETRVIFRNGGSPKEFFRKTPW